MLYIWFNIGSFFLLFSMASIELGESVYINHFMSSLFLPLSLLISAAWIDVSSVSARLLVMSSNTAAKPTFLGFLIHQCRLPFYYISTVFSRCLSPCVFLRHSRILCCLPIYQPWGLLCLCSSLLRYTPVSFIDLLFSL